MRLLGRVRAGGSRTAKTPHAAAQKQWETAFRYDKEDRQPEHLLVYGGQLAFAELIAAAPRGPTSRRTRGRRQRRTRFGVYARRLWDGLLAHEALIDR